MQIKTRREAIIAKENIYFTGNPCRNGHISYRYVQSGTCADCINFKTNSVNCAREERLSLMAKIVCEKDAANNEKADVIRQFKERRAIVENSMVAIRLRAYPEDRTELALIAYGFAAMREPRLTADDIHPSSKPVSPPAAGTAMYLFYCFHDDANELYAAANACLTRRPLMDPNNKDAEDLKHKLAKVDQGDGSEPKPGWR